MLMIIICICVVSICYHGYKLRASKLHTTTSYLKAYKHIYYKLLVTNDKATTDKVAKLSSYQLSRLDDIIKHQPNINIDQAIEYATDSYF